MKVKMKNQLYLGLFSVIIGVFAGAVVWLFLKIIIEGTAFLWEWLPQKVDIPFYTVLVCTAGGLICGLIRKKFGDYPEELAVVLGKMRKEKRYEYRQMPVMILSALLPLLLGSSIGPEAGLAGIIVALCCWAGENLKFARQNAREYSEVGMAVTLGVLFHSPLFGIFSVEEDAGEQKIYSLTRTSKILLYGLALSAGSGSYLLLSKMFGAAMEGLPSFPAAEPKWEDYLMILVYIAGGLLLTKFYQLTYRGSQKLAGRIPGVLREAVGGLFLGIVGSAVPAVMFSGEEQMGILMDAYVEYLPITLVCIAFIKILLTNVCIESGLKGGHFFPVIFAGVCFGYGVAGLIFQESAGHVVFAAAIVTATLLGGIMKKPLAVTMILFICFPVRLFVWIFLAAALGSRCAAKPLD